jgi:hypothetical protein
MQGDNFWVVNHLPWYAGGVHQCVCTHIREGAQGNTVSIVFIYTIITVQYLEPSALVCGQCSPACLHSYP